MRTDALKALAIALVLTLCAAPAAIAQEGRTPAAPVSDVDRAVVAFKAGRYAEAMATARRAADASPTAVRALTTRASIAEFMGEFDEARTFYDKAATLTPDDPGLIYRQASHALRVGEYDRALAQLDRLLALHPQQVRWLFQYAPTRLQAQLLRDNPSLEHIVQIKIDILMEKGDLAQARRMAQGYAIVQPNQDYCGQARSVMAGRNREDVFKAFRLATLGQPDAADCIWWYGQWLSDEGYVRLGRLMVVEGARVTGSATNKEGAARYVRIRLGGNRDVPKRAEQLFLIARQRYLRDGDIEGATRLFDECIRLAPGFARPYNYRALMAADLGDREAALAWFQKGLKADADSWRTHRNLGKLLSEMERYPEAEMHLRKTVELFGDDAGGRIALARVLYAEGKYDDFLKEASAAVAILNAKTQIVDVREFLSKFDRWGPGAALPPAPDPNVIIGWNYD